MYGRELGKQLNAALKKSRVITLVGPRQSGKTTLLKYLFHEANYQSMESPDKRALALADPRGFFSGHNGLWIIDEVQRTPELLSYIQEFVDDPVNPNRFILTGSHNLLLMEKVSQSLAGRTRVFTLLPMSHAELRKAGVARESVDEAMFYGGYPRIYNENLEPEKWIGDYYQTYVEKDVRALQNITDLALFERFVELCAARTGQLCNTSSLGQDCGISHNTARSWLSVLETSFVLFSLRPHHKNFNKRIIKTPKLYFYDTALLCFLLRIKTAEHLRHHPLRGNIFENWVIAESFKSKYHQGERPAFYFWRDQKGHEVDLIDDQGDWLLPMEIKSSMTFHPDFSKGIDYLNRLQGREGGAVVYGGDETFKFKGIQVQPWNTLG